MAANDGETATGIQLDAELERLVRVYRTDLHERSACWDPRNRGNVAILAELERRAVSLLLRRGRLPVGPRTALDVGCGYGHFLGLLARLGADRANLHGVDLLPERIAH